MASRGPTAVGLRCRLAHLRPHGRRARRRSRPGGARRRRRRRPGPLPRYRESPPADRRGGEGPRTGPPGGAGPPSRVGDRPPAAPGPGPAGLRPATGSRLALAPGLVHIPGLFAQAGIAEEVLSSRLPLVIFGVRARSRAVVLGHQALVHFVVQGAIKVIVDPGDLLPVAWMAASAALPLLVFLAPRTPPRVRRTARRVHSTSYGHSIPRDLLRPHPGPRARRGRGGRAPQHRPLPARSGPSRTASTRSSSWTSAASS